jgi:carboxymethylenebutenolidase
MNVTSERIERSGLRLRAFVPSGAGRFPGVLAFSDIFQHTGPHVRLCTRLAARGFVVLTPELYGRFEAPGRVFDFEADRQAALDAAATLRLEWIDEDLATALAALKAHPRVEGALHAVGWCLGGHLAFRAALSPEVRATVCFYATGLHTDSVGAAVGTAKTLARAAELKGELLMVWGSRDPHIPPEGRQRIHAALASAGTAFQSLTFDAEHAFMRDEGPRWEPAATDEAFEAAVRVLRKG